MYRRSRFDPRHQEMPEDFDIKRQYARDGDGWLFRRRTTGPAIRVSDEEAQIAIDHEYAARSPGLLREAAIGVVTMFVVVPIFIWITHDWLAWVFVASFGWPVAWALTEWREERLSRQLYHHWKIRPAIKPAMPRTSRVLRKIVEFAFANFGMIGPGVAAFLMIRGIYFVPFHQQHWLAVAVTWTSLLLGAFILTVLIGGYGLLIYDRFRAKDVAKAKRKAPINPD